MNPARQRRSRAAVEVERSAREPEGRAVQKMRRKDMRFTKAHHLLSQENAGEAQGIVGRRMRLAVVCGVHAGVRVTVREVLVHSRGAKVLADPLPGVAEGFSNSTWRSRGGWNFRAIGDRPQREQRPDARHSAGARCGVRDQREIAKSQRLPKAFVVPEQKRLVLAQWTAQRSTELIALKLRDVPVVEEVPRVQCAVPDEFIDVAVELISSRRGNDVNLRSRAFAVLGAVGVLDHGKLAHGIHTQELTTYTAGSVVNLRRPGKLDAV